MPNTFEIGKNFVALCNENKNMDAIDQYYADNIVSVEAMDMPNMPATQNGIEAVKAKNNWWVENNEVHAKSVKGPFPNGDKFAVQFSYDITNKQTGQRSQMDEVGLYTVENGKITREEYFYPTEK